MGNIFYEHTHRLIASLVGFLTLILAGWLWVKEERAWLRRLGLIAVFGVITQGVLGGLRVTLLKDQIGVFHAILAQMFFVLVCAIALFTSEFWERLDLNPSVAEVAGRMRWLFAGLAMLVLLQLMLGAMMRHQHAGLAIPDFPLAYGKWWPATDPASVFEYNRSRTELVGYREITSFQVNLQMIHRIVACCIVFGVFSLLMLTSRRLPGQPVFVRPMQLLAILVTGQFCLGAATIWTGKSADIATAHVAVGACSLLTTAILTLLAFAAHRFSQLSATQWVRRSEAFEFVARPSPT